MSKPTTPEEILSMPDDERDAYAAEVCMRWHLVEIGAPSPFLLEDRSYWNSQSGDTGCYADEWQPSQPTDLGKAWCWDLIAKYRLMVDFDNDAVLGPGWAGDCVSVHGEVTQARVVTAAILCALKDSGGADA